MNLSMMFKGFMNGKRQSYGQVWNRAWRPSPWVIVSGISTNGRGPNKPRRLTLVSALKTRALAGKGPFEALARGGRGTAIHGWWCQLPVSQGSEFLLVCRLEREDGSGPVEAHKGPGFQL